MCGEGSPSSFVAVRRLRRGKARQGEVRPGGYGVVSHGEARSASYGG